MIAISLMLFELRVCEYHPAQPHANSLLTVQITRLHVNPLPVRCRLEVIRDEELIEHQASDHELPPSAP